MVIKCLKREIALFASKSKKRETLKMNKDHREEWQQYQLSLSDLEVKMQAQAMIMHNNNEG
ncbi:hypothetical protein N9K64_07290, partial [Rhodobacteraceae bacterium]|nr:hypothetical protein [Paracoccaceae bacterium]